MAYYARNGKPHRINAESHALAPTEEKRAVAHMRHSPIQSVQYQNDERGDYSESFGFSSLGSLDGAGFGSPAGAGVAGAGCDGAAAVGGFVGAG